jgi:hypothetical protein
MLVETPLAILTPPCNNSGISTQQDVYYSRAWWPTGGWSAPRNLGDAVNTPGVETFI